MVWESSYWLEETGGGPLTNQRLLLWKGRVLINWKKLAAIYTWKVLYPGPGVDSSDCPLAEDDRLYFSPRLHKNNIFCFVFYRPPKPRILLHNFYSIALCSAALQTAVCGGPCPRFEPVTSDRGAGTRTTKPLHQFSSFYMTQLHSIAIV